MKELGLLLIIFGKEDVWTEFDFYGFIVILAALFIAFIISYRISKKYKIYPREKLREEKETKQSEMPVQVSNY